MIASVARKRTRWLGLAATAAALVLAVPITAASAYPVQARKDIQAMGLDYNGPAFAKVAGNGDMAAVKLYLDAGMDVNEGGSAAIGLAAGRGKLEMDKFLLSVGAKPTSNALQYARTRGYKDVEQVLVDAGAKE